MTVAAFVLAGRCSVTVRLPLSKWLFLGLFPRWWPISRKWCPKCVSRVIFECSSFRVSPVRPAVFTFTDALIGFMTNFAGATGGGVGADVEDKAFWAEDTETRSLRETFMVLVMIEDILFPNKLQAVQWLQYQQLSGGEQESNKVFRDWFWIYLIAMEAVSLLLTCTAISCGTRIWIWTVINRHDGSWILESRSFVLQCGIWSRSRSDFQTFLSYGDRYS